QNACRRNRFAARALFWIAITNGFRELQRLTCGNRRERGQFRDREHSIACSRLKLIPGDNPGWNGIQFIKDLLGRSWILWTSPKASPPNVEVAQEWTGRSARKSRCQIDAIKEIEIRGNAFRRAVKKHNGEIAVVGKISCGDIRVEGRAGRFFGEYVTERFLLPGSGAIREADSEQDGAGEAFGE